MDKYQLPFLKQVDDHIDRWKQANGVSREEWRLFLHSVIGTGASIGLVYLTNWAKETMSEEQSFPDWLDMNRLNAYLRKMPKNTKRGISTINQVEVDRDPSLLLIVDHDPIFMTEVKEWLESKGYMVLVALTVQKALQLTQLQNPNCLLINHFFIRNSLLGIKLLKRSIREFVPVMIIGDTDVEEQRITAFNYGVTDYLAKPLISNRLVAQLANRVQHAKRIQDRILTDPLTGAFNRRFLEVEGNRYLELFQRGQEFFSLAMVDLDHFKRINDQHGHLVGDEVLKTFSKLVQDQVREGDVFIRFGGEEFVLLLPHTTATQAEVLVQRLRTTFDNHLFKNETGTFKATFSAGICEVTKEWKTLAEMLEKVDQALYKAKELGRNRTLLYGDHMEKGLASFELIIVEDDMVLREALVEQAKTVHVEEVEITVTSYESGTRFMETDWFKPDGKYLISLDRMMPGLDGIDVLARLRRDFPESQVMVLMLTSSGEPSDIAEALTYGTDDYITKPFNQVELIARMRRLIERSISKNIGR
ncbi:GGDEF domain-containing response regulator [Shouchella lehensis]|uniref:Diguanylate cyclase n=1 Tax=Shouchella lehensis TaxID=300825 RepID=A0A4Y7WLI6_9BACI|nr:diguanylate cyclase [Shouchella lehensis]MBG9783080.1 hypothetical protein [Shouchella lehensis]TES49556.1 diguanylate cyclase [Shouchella lehensis]